MGSEQTHNLESDKSNYRIGLHFRRIPFHLFGRSEAKAKNDTHFFSSDIIFGIQDTGIYWCKFSFSISLQIMAKTFQKGTTVPRVRITPFPSSRSLLEGARSRGARCKKGKKEKGKRKKKREKRKSIIGGGTLLLVECMFWDLSQKEYINSLAIR